MEQGYEEYCLADPIFYDSCTVTRGDDVDFAIADRPLPEGWRRVPSDDWLICWPEDVEMPQQGWKIHASTCLDNAEDVLAVVFEYCVPRRIPFKFIRSLQYVLLRNSKYADRGASGKFVTIYPKDETELRTILEELGTMLEGQPGPYILSDLRWGDGPLFVRYGGFAERYCLGPDGELVLAIADEAGELVPDARGPVFKPPSWVPLPPFLEPHLTARANATVKDLPFTVERALHFSNGGGLYEGVDQRTGSRIVLKEARPHAGLDRARTDAVARLERERQILERLAGLESVPRVVDSFDVGDHRFLAMEFIEGESLSDQVVGRYPLLTDEADPAEVAAYTAWAVDMCTAVERAIDALHQRGVVFRDFHPNNVLVRPDGSIALIDFEVSGDVDDGLRPTLGAPGFAPPHGCAGVDVDRYALACLRLYMFLPLTSMFAFDRTKARHLAAEIATLFPVPEGYLDEAATTIVSAGRPDGIGTGAPVWDLLAPDVDGWPAARASIVAAIRASATPERDDRLFPGDIKQFQTGGLNLAYGAAGVLYALAETGAGRSGDYEEWLVQRATHPEPGSRLGFYDGLQGVAYVLDRFEYRAEAQKVLDICMDDVKGRWDRLGLDLFGGLSGIALNLHHLGERHADPSVSELAWTVAQCVADRLGDEDSTPAISGGAHPYAGLMRGSSGPALLFIRLYERSGDGSLLDLAATALAQDLRRCVAREDGALEVDEGWRTMPYLMDGSVGVGMVLEEYLRHRHDDRFAAAAAAIRRTASSEFFIEPGLFYGRSGMLLHLAGGQSQEAAAADPRVARHVRRLAWHAVDYDGNAAFPGEMLLRLSMDLASGSAGVLFALASAFHDTPVHLPFLRPTRREGAAEHVLSQQQKGGD